MHSSSIKQVLSSVGMPGWTIFDDAFTKLTPQETLAAGHAMKDTVLIVVTSGATSLPKEFPHSNESVASMCARHKVMYSVDEIRVSCNHMPVFHLAGVMESLWAWAHKGTVVYPIRTFDARTTLDAIGREHCTDMCLVPGTLCFAP